MSALVELLRPATDDAVTRYLHRTEFRAWHKRRGISPDNCPACIDQRQQAEADRYERTRLTVVDEVSPLQPWQRKLANEVLEAKTAELDAVVAETETSPALKAYLEEHKLVPDPRTVELSDYSMMTAKDLRPYAASSGMKGARTAKKAAMLEFLATTV